MRDLTAPKADYSMSSIQARDTVEHGPSRADDRALPGRPVRRRLRSTAVFNDSVYDARIEDNGASDTRLFWLQRSSYLPPVTSMKAPVV